MKYHVLRSHLVEQARKKRDYDKIVLLLLSDSNKVKSFSTVFQYCHLIISVYADFVSSCYVCDTNMKQTFFLHNFIRAADSTIEKLGRGARSSC